mmetsp:Transcript_5678/g.16900  ORF Transcript_5678/g.16900 Transcript_5678/m.16900 type:complete len:110 (-) Transcript_5678:202-531(-)
MAFTIVPGFSNIAGRHGRNVCKGRTRYVVREIGLSGLSEEGDLPMPDKDCTKCKGSGYVDCEICKGTGKDRKNGSVLERWTCKACKGFGYVGCDCIQNAGLTPEQRGTR